MRRGSGSRSLSPSATFQRPPSQQQQQPQPQQQPQQPPNDTSPRETTSPSRTSIPQPPSEPDLDRRSPFQSFSAAGQQSQAAQPPARGSWAPKWPAGGHRSRHSIDTPVTNLKSPSPPASSPRKGDRTTEPPQASSAGADIVFTRDVTNRQPRSMMACMRCRRQK